MSGKREEKISSTELFAAIYIYISADALTAPIGAPAGEKSWISIIIATIIAVGYAWVYAHLSDSNSGKSIIEIGEQLFGKLFGKIIGFLYFWFSFEICTYNMKNNWQMTSTVALPNTLSWSSP